MWFRRRSVEETIVIADLVKVVGELRARVGILEAEVTKCAVQYESLRGRFYALKLHKQPVEGEPDPKPAQKSREEVLRERFTPGKPVTHRN